LYETAEFAIVPMRAQGTLPAIRNPYLALDRPTEEPACGIDRGCHPLAKYQTGVAQPHLLATPDEGGAGLPSNIIVNAESAGLQANAEGLQPELWLMAESDPTSSEPNRFVCIDSIDVGDCPAVVQGPAVVKSSPVVRALPDDITVISETDYVWLLQKGDILEFEREYIATRIVSSATIANAPEVRGVFSNSVNGYVDGPVAVARDLTQTATGLEATSFYFPTIGVRGYASLAGHNVKFGLSGSRNFTLEGPCGAVSLSTGGWCEHLACIPPGIPVETGNPQYGTPRWPSKSRATLRTFDIGRPLRDVSVYACSEFRPPPMQHRCGGSASWWVGTEFCNGEDDDCDGEIDESGVCNACTY
jgi:hypothetical protein